VEDVIAHPWFQEFKIEDLMEKKIVAPYVPVIKEADDTSNFDERFSALEIVESIIDPSKKQLIEKHKDDFETF
jgi:hypothetical protein